jgi:signal transduction histidine kinase
LGNALKLRERPTVVASRPVSSPTSLADRIAAIAAIGAETLAAERCAIQSSGAGADALVFAPVGESRWDAPLKAILIALDNRLGDLVAATGMKRTRRAPGSFESIAKIVLSVGEVEAIVGHEENGRRIASVAFTDGAGAVRIAAVTRADRARAEVEASLEFMARAVFSEINLTAARASLDFWRTHGAEGGRQALGAKRELHRQRAFTNHLAEAVAAARQVRPHERFRRFGELVASGAGFDQWLVAVSDGGSFIVAASSSGQKQFNLAETGSALAESFQRRIVIVRWRDRDAGVDRQFSEDKIFGGSYVCIPFEAGAIALGSRDGAASAAKAEAIVERLAPFAVGWVIEREASRRSHLVRQLALRMFAAIDEERAKIARDLHDDQAQLLAAAQIALEGGREAARKIFKQVEEELRRKTRELRPATMGTASLGEAIQREFVRLESAGVTATLIQNGMIEKISRVVQQLCFQVVREALSNVIRHAHAKSVQVAINSTGAAAQVSVSDDGCGIAGDHSDGIGLAGVRERLELMGGRLTVESRAGCTTIVAEIPESA